MHAVVLWFGFLGAWLLVAGPVYQAGVELRAEEEASERFRHLATRVEAPATVSAWWWLLPPVHVVLTQRRRAELRRQVVDLLTPEDLEVVRRYLAIARGWTYVAGGAALIALKETWELLEHYELPVAVYVVVVLVMGLGALSFFRGGGPDRGRPAR